MATFYYHTIYTTTNSAHHEVQEFEADTLKEAMLKEAAIHHNKLIDNGAPDVIVEAHEKTIERIKEDNPVLVHGIHQIPSDIDWYFWSDSKRICVSNIMKSSLRKWPSK